MAGVPGWRGGRPVEPGELFGGQRERHGAGAPLVKGMLHDVEGFEVGVGSSQYGEDGLGQVVCVGATDRVLSARHGEDDMKSVGTS